MADAIQKVFSKVIKKVFLPRRLSAEYVQKAVDITRIFKQIFWVMWGCASALRDFAALVRQQAFQHGLF